MEIDRHIFENNDKCTLYYERLKRATNFVQYSEIKS